MSWSGERVAGITMRLARHLMMGAARPVTVSLPRVGDTTLVAAAGFLALLAGASAVRSLQAATALALLVLLVAIHGQSRRAGLAGLWTLWLLAPVLRRVLALTAGTPTADPLALLPFVATGVIALLELRRLTMSGPARTTLALAALGFMIGAPMGLLTDPVAFTYGLMAYLAGLSAFVLGWGDGKEGEGLTLVRTLVVLLPPLALYGILQYFFPLTSWDSTWVETADLASIGAPQEGHIRVFSTLNSPGTFGLVLAIGILLAFALRRRSLVAAFTTTLVIGALALTFVRSAWLSLAVGVVVFLAADRGRSAGKMVAVIAVCLVGLVIVGGSNPTTKAFTQRVTSLGSPGEDRSTQDRLKFTSTLLPTAVGQPLGAGVGQAGLSVRLDESSGNDSLQSTDNGYLALLYQMGLLGFLLVVYGMARSVVAATRSLRAEGGQGRATKAAVLATLIALLVSEAAGDVLYGISGAIFWYLAGVAFVDEAKKPDVGRPQANGSEAVATVRSS